jgi:hypothetical protein
VQQGRIYPAAAALDPNSSFAGWADYQEEADDDEWERAMDFTEGRVLGRNLVFMVELGQEIGQNQAFQKMLLGKLRSFQLLPRGCVER